MKSQFHSIPLRNYFDENFFFEEIKNLFSSGHAEFLGTTDRFKNDGDYLVINRTADAKVLIQNEGKIRLFDNICSHRQALLLSGQGNQKKVMCPIHHWVYNLEGRCERTPMMECDKHQMNLQEYSIHRWGQFLFSGSPSWLTSLNEFKPFSNLDLANYRYSKSFREEIEVNWKHLIDVFTEDYHVPFVHPGFSSTVVTESLERFNYAAFTAQTFLLRPKSNLATCRTTPTYRAWLNILLEAYPENLPDYAGVLILLYPNLMIEWYPFSLIFSSVHPVSIDRTVVHMDFYHDQTALEKFPQLAEIAEASFAETAKEDNELCNRMVLGRKALFLQGREESGPLQPDLEEGTKVFHDYYLKAMARQRM